MRMILCMKCMVDMRTDRDVTRNGSASIKDKCGICGKKRWCGMFDVDMNSTKKRGS